MHKKVKTITLHRETLRRLEALHLGQIGGGFSIPPAQCGDSNDTCDPCPTYSCGIIRCL